MSQSRTRSWLPIACIAVLVALTCYVGVFFIARWLKPWWAYEPHALFPISSPVHPKAVLVPRDWFATAMYPLRYAVARWRRDSTYRHDLDNQEYIYNKHNDYCLVHVRFYSYKIRGYLHEFFVISPGLHQNHSVFDRINENTPVKLSFRQKLTVDVFGKDLFEPEVTSIEPVP